MQVTVRRLVNKHDGHYLTVSKKHLTFKGTTKTKPKKLTPNPKVAGSISPQFEQPELLVGFNDIMDGLMAGEMFVLRFKRLQGRNPQ